jgi:hypothetical protein
MANQKPNAETPQPLPQEGGAFVRQPDGGLLRDVEPEPAPAPAKPVKDA